VIEGSRQGDVVDLAVVLGDSRWKGKADRTLRISATSWSADLGGEAMGPIWSATDIPFGRLGAGALAAGEAFKVAMQRLTPSAAHAAMYSELFAPTLRAHVQIAPEYTLCPSELGAIDMIGAGAIGQAVLFALARIPDVTGTIRTIDPQESDPTNLNRYPLLLRSRVGQLKANDLLNSDLGGLVVVPISRQFVLEDPVVRTLADRALVTVDDIPTRWNAQRATRDWLGVGATTHYSAMASFHDGDLPCAGCLHPKDDPNDVPIQTVSFVSHWAGLMLAALLVWRIAGSDLKPSEQQSFFTSIRPEKPMWTTPVARREDCPVGCGQSINKP